MVFYSQIYNHGVSGGSGAGAEWCRALLLPRGFLHIPSSHPIFKKLFVTVYGSYCELCVHAVEQSSPFQWACWKKDTNPLLISKSSNTEEQWYIESKGHAFKPTTLKLVSVTHLNVLFSRSDSRHLPEFKIIYSLSLKKFLWIQYLCSIES